MFTAIFFDLFFDLIGVACCAWVITKIVNMFKRMK